MSPRPLVLVPGACLGGWAWREVAQRLRAFGHDVYPVTLTGLGDRVHLSHAGVDLNTHIADVLAVLDHEDLSDAVLVGHSYAGLVVAGAADRRPERLDAVVYLDCSPLPDGMAICDVQTPEQRDTQRSAVESNGDGWRWPVPDRATLETGQFGSTAGLTDKHFAAIAQRGTPQPYATFTSPLRLEHQSPPDVRRSAIFCTAGGITVAAVRELIAQGDPRAAPFADPDWDLRELPTGHWAMFSAPEQVAETLHNIAGCRGRPRAPGLLARLPTRVRAGRYGAEAIARVVERAGWHDASRCSPLRDGRLRRPRQTTSERTPT